MLRKLTKLVKLIKLIKLIKLMVNLRQVVKVGAKPLTWFVTLEDISVHLPLL